MLPREEKRALVWLSFYGHSIFKKVLLLWEQRILTLQFEEQTGTELF